MSSPLYLEKIMTTIVQWSNLDPTNVTANTNKYLGSTFDNGAGVYIRNQGNNPSTDPHLWIKVQFDITTTFAARNGIIIFGLAQAGNTQFTSNQATFITVPVNLNEGALEAGSSFIVPFPAFAGRQFIRPSFSANIAIADTDGRFGVTIYNELQVRKP